MSITVRSQEFSAWCKYPDTHNSVADTTEDKNRPTVRNGDMRTNYASEQYTSKIFSRHLFMPVRNGSAHLKRPME